MSSAAVVIGALRLKMSQCQTKKVLGVHVISYIKAYSLDTVNPLYNDIRYNSKIRYKVNSVCTKISKSCIFSLIVPCYSLRKHKFWIFTLKTYD